MIEEAGERVLAKSVRLLVHERIKAWNGEAMGISRHWVEEAIAAIGREYQAAARLTLLTAFASYQVDSGVIEAFRSQYDGSRADAQLIAATAWASFTAAPRVGEWLVEPFKLTI